MPRLTTTIVLLLLAILGTSLFAANPQPSLQSLNHTPLAFTKNNGQWDSRVLFRTTSGGATIWICRDRIVYQYIRRVGIGTNAVSGHSREGGNPGSVGVAPRGYPHEGNHMGLPLHGDETPDSLDQLVITARFIDANPNPDIIAAGQMEYKCNYFLGNDPTQWHTNVPNYEAVTLRDLYPGIDLKLSSDVNNQATYEFITTPAVDNGTRARRTPSCAAVKYEGVESTHLDSDGRLILKTKWGEMVAAIDPTTSTAGLVSPRFVLNEERTSGIAGEGQSLSGAKSGTLELEYSTFLGGENFDFGNAIAIGSDGSAYVIGTTSSLFFPTLSPYQTHPGAEDVFVAKFSSTGSCPIYSTYLGGGESDFGYGIDVDGSGSAFVTGQTGSTDFPTEHPYQTDQWGYDAFVTRLNSAGDSLIYSTYLGGGSQDGGQDVAIDNSENAYVTGSTSSEDYPIRNPFETYQGSSGYDDAFVTKLSSSGTNLVYSTYLGGEYIDRGYGIAVDSCGGAYVTGNTWSSDFPTLYPYQAAHHGGVIDAFVTRLTRNGDSLVYSTYLGGEEPDQGLAIAIDADGNAYVTGSTQSSGFPTSNPCQSGCGAFVTKFLASGRSLAFSKCLGDGLGRDIAVDDGGNAYVVGIAGPGFPTASPFQANQGGRSDAFVTKLSAADGNLIYSTFLGGLWDDDGCGIAIDRGGAAYVTGNTSSSDFPIESPYLGTIQGQCDAFVTKLIWTPAYLCGDTDGDESITIADVVFLVNYIFAGGPAPEPISVGDTDCGGDINIADAVHLINYIFSSGPAPCSECDL